MILSSNSTNRSLDTRNGDSGYVSTTGVSTQQQYSAAGQIKSVQEGSALDLQYNVDNGGRIAGITENGDEQRFAYNADGVHGELQIHVAIGV